MANTSPCSILLLFLRYAMTLSEHSNFMPCHSRLWSVPRQASKLLLSVSYNFDEDFLLFVAKCFRLIRCFIIFFLNGEVNEN